MLAWLFLAALAAAVVLLPTGWAVLLGACLLFSVLSALLEGRVHSWRGRRLEAKGDFRGACDAYALAIVTGSPDATWCRSRVRALWAEHGPFDWSDWETETPDPRDICCEGCASHAMTMTVIRECVEADGPVAAVGS